MHGTGGLSSGDDGLVLALTGGEDWIPAMAGALHPPFSLFLPEEKEKTGRARSKREKEGTGTIRGRGTVQAISIRKSPVRGVVQAGVFGG